MKDQTNTRRRALRDGDQIGRTPTHEIVFRNGRRIYLPARKDTRDKARRQRPV